MPCNVFYSSTVSNLFNWLVDFQPAPGSTQLYIHLLSDADGALEEEG